MNNVTVSIGIVLVIAIVGFIIWWIASRPGKIWAEFGRLVFFAAFLAFCFALSGSFLATCSTSNSAGAPPAAHAR